MIKQDQYVTILGWMRNIPEIQSNSELLAYALIYGFSQTKGQYLTCRQSYIADWLGVSRENCSRLLKKMESNGLIKKQVEKKQGAIKTYKYFAVQYNTSDETSHAECKNVTRTSDETSHATSDVFTHNDNNIYNNKYIYPRNKKENSSDNQFMQFMKRDYDIEQLELDLLGHHADHDGEQNAKGGD